MDVFTAQMAQWRTVTQHGIEMVNTTFKSGLPLFAPTQQLVYGYKYHGMSEDEYRSRYLAMMNQSFFSHQQQWEEFLMFHQNGRIALACYCGPGEFCHRHLLAPLLGKVCRHYNVPYTYFGELY